MKIILVAALWILTVFASAPHVETDGPAPRARDPLPKPKNKCEEPIEGEPPKKEYKSTGAPTPFAGTRLYLPPSGGPAPAVVLLHGSEGGAPSPITDADATWLAGQGFVVMTYCYYRCLGKPDRLYNVELGDTIKAADWLKRSPHVQGKKVGLLGFSRGAEKALILASRMKDTKLFSAVAAHAPSDRVVCSFDPTSKAQVVVEPLGKKGGKDRFRLGAAWKWRGEPLYGDQLKDDTVDVRKLDLADFTDDDIPGPRIPVEKYEGPMFVSHGTDDEVWSVQKSRNIEKSRAAQKDRTEVHYFEGECHNFREVRNLRRWERLVASFFRRHLDRR